MKYKDKLVLPRDCEKLSLSSCTDPRLKGRCKVQYGKLGFGSKCTENKNYEIEKYIFEKGFEDFVEIDEENAEEEMKNRNKLCSKLDPSRNGTCSGNLGKKLGCVVKKRFFSKDQCILDPKIVYFFEKREKICRMDDCNEIKLKYGILCGKCKEKLEELLREYNAMYKDLKKQKIVGEKDDKKFTKLYEDLINDWYVYLVEKPKVINNIEEMKLIIEEKTGKLKCQAFNVTSCGGKGDIQRQCKNNGYITKYGLFCNIHCKCFKSKKESFVNFRDNFESLCKKGLCPSLITKNKEFYEMIKISTKGEASKIKRDVRETIELAEEYMKY